MTEHGDGGSSEDSEDGSIMQATQTERQILLQITNKFGTLPRSTFVSDMCSEFNIKDLSEFRRSLYDLAVDIIPGTPVGRLMVRKDTQNSGGKCALEKVADDVYVLYQYHEGDTSMDITKLLTERSRKQWNRENAPTILSQVSVDHINPTDNSNIQAKPLLEFCRELMVEMRKDRDIINDHLVTINQQLGSLPGLERDIRELRSDVNTIKERVIKAETHLSHCSNSQSDIHAKLNQVQSYETQMTQFRKGVDQNIAGLRSAFASSTSRINNIELTLSQIGNLSNKSISKPPCYSAHSSSTGNRSPQSGSPGPILQTVSQSELILRNSPERDADQDQTYAKTITTSPRRRENAVDNISSVATGTSSGHRTNHYIDSGIKQALQAKTPHSGVTVTFDTDEESTQRTTSYSTPDNNKSSDTLRGFIPVNRPRGAPFFLSGILMKDDNRDNVDETINDIYDYMKRKDCAVKSVRKIKQSGIVLSVKIVALQSDSDKLLDPHFWPAGIRCRKWTN